jgi:hypothetical protein
MNVLPVYHLITRDSDFMHCIAYDGSYRISKSNEPANRGETSSED